MAALADKKTSRFRGVSRHRQFEWQTTIWVKGVGAVYIGVSRDEETAARRYDEYVREHGLTGKKLNFPRPFSGEHGHAGSVWEGVD